jgi:hypothetical protein
MALKRRHSLAIATVVALAGAAGAQPLPPANVPNAPPPPPTYQQQPTQQQFQNNNASSPTCQRLEAALAQVNRGPAGANSETVSRYEDAIFKQRQELDQAMSTARRLGCERRGFFIFGGSQRPEQCNQLEPQIDRMRANLDRMQQELSQVRGGNSDANYTRDLQRRQILVSLNQNNCGPQYRNVALPPARPRGFLDQLFGNTDENPDVAPNEMPNDGSGGFRTVCVRMCDGAFFPISFATVQNRFGEDEALCKRQCPAAEVALYTTATRVRIFSRRCRSRASFILRCRTRSNSAPNTIRTAPAADRDKAGRTRSDRIRRSSAATSSSPSSNRSSSPSRSRRR